jgi:hypothetical protein
MLVNIRLCLFCFLAFALFRSTPVLFAVNVVNYILMFFFLLISNQGSMEVFAMHTLSDKNAVYTPLTL